MLQICTELKLVANPMLFKQAGFLQSIELFVHRPRHSACQPRNLAHMQPLMRLEQQQGKRFASVLQRK